MKISLKTSLLPCFALLLLLLASGCGAAGSVLPSPSPAATPEPLGPTAPVPADFSWLRVSLPDGWSESEPGYYEGADGFARLELRESQGAGPGAVCMGEANRDKPARYGAYPEIRDLTLLDQPACLILPSSDQPPDRRGEALYLLWLPEQIRADGLLALHADREHIQAIVESLGLAQPAAEAATAPCDFSVAGSAPETTRAGGLRVDAFPIAQGAGCSPYRAAAAFSEQVERGAAGARAGQVKGRLFQGERLWRINEPLMPFGFQVQTDGQIFRVQRAGEDVLSNLSWLGQLSVRADGQDFIFPVLDGYNATAYLVRPNGVHVLDAPDLLVYDQVFPVYAGADRINLLYDYERYPRPYGRPALLEVRKNGTLIDTISVSGANPAKGPVHGLWSWQDADGAVHWTLALAGLVVEDGEMLNDRLGAAEILSWRLLHERPFYFYRADGQLRAVYDGQPLPLVYDEIIAEPQWGERILVQMRAYESALVFYARQGDTWSLVVLEVGL